MTFRFYPTAPHPPPLRLMNSPPADQLKITFSTFFQVILLSLTRVIFSDKGKMSRAILAKCVSHVGRNIIALSSAQISRHASSLGKNFPSFLHRGLYIRIQGHLVPSPKGITADVTSGEKIRRKGEKEDKGKRKEKRKGTG
jgi:hypothetical protein